MLVSLQARCIGRCHIRSMATHVVQSFLGVGVDHICIFVTTFLGAISPLLTTILLRIIVPASDYLLKDSRSSRWAKLQRRFPGCPLLPSLEATFISSCGGIQSHCFGFRHCSICTHRIVIMSGTFCHCFSARHTHARRHQSVTITRIQLLARSQPFARRTL